MIYLTFTRQLFYHKRLNNHHHLLLLQSQINRHFTHSINPSDHHHHQQQQQQQHLEQCHHLLLNRIKSFSVLPTASLNYQTLTSLGFINKNKASSHLIRSLSQSFSSSILHTLSSQHKDTGRLDNQISNLISDLKDLVINNSGSGDNVRIGQSHDLITQLDHSILSHFISWVSSNHHQPQSIQNSNRSSCHLNLQSLFDSTSRLVDIKRPHELYPDSRRFKRQIHLHIGPTNSGKTYAGLRALHGAHTGVYAGPLRLLAHEVFSRFNQGKISDDLPARQCNLLTGEEQRIVGQSVGLTSCTVEMISTKQFYDVVVIDEIQMISDRQRGDAWTQAFLGVQSKQIHLCGEESVLELIRDLTDSCGDQLILHRYNRLTPLKVSDSSLAGDLTRLRPGDCLVTFSRQNIYSLRRSIQSVTDLRVGIAYGALPPEVREKEAQMFNIGSDPSEQDAYDVLVGSDAIGMGLNLKIKRVIFESLHKYDGKSQIRLSSSQIKQIAGRAGRFGLHSKQHQPVKTKINTTTNSSNQTTLTNISDGVFDQNDHHLEGVGEVLTLQESDMELLRSSMEEPIQPIRRATIKAPFSTIEGLSRLLPDQTSYSTLLRLRRSLTITSPNFVIGDEQSAIEIADSVGSEGSLSLLEKDLFCNSPCNSRNLLLNSAIRAWARKHGERGEVNLGEWLKLEGFERTMRVVRENMLKINEMKKLLNETDKILKKRKLDESFIKSDDDQDDGEFTVKMKIRRLESDQNEAIKRLESIHKCLVLYLWLSFRLPESFRSFKECLDLKSQCEEVLSIGLKF
ncbi:P-loop containing nucleoside triphosphate hydrolase protein [Phakopsora pachyrhizi]|uniref:RNA helicase n=1 Tax=Phakopsora pachyrhizi TaxID=170000 RepID=A0AAV0BRP0_PHAPC|nr:P-loop containing nucleoside triphosphate hydrolase protein [Phakopsora pachyrhizi]